jgi:Uma2 family endonuclease
MATLTLEQFLQQEETKPASEYACGEVYQKPMPDGPHSSIQLFLSVVLYQYLAQSGIGRVFPELRCIFGPPGRERTYVPDLVYVSNAHLPVPRHLHYAPDLAIEVLSPDQHWAQFLDKIQFYLLHGVRLIWVFDPAASTVTVEAPGVEARILRPGDTLDGGEVLPGFSVPVADIFAQVDR